jgi:centromeric protein E
LISVFYSLILFLFLVDHVFDESCTNSRVYELLTKDLILAAVDGFNGMIH